MTYVGSYSFFPFIRSVRVWSERKQPGSGVTVLGIGMPTGRCAKYYKRLPKLEARYVPLGYCFKTSSRASSSICIITCSCNCSCSIRRVLCKFYFPGRHPRLYRNHQMFWKCWTYLFNIKHTWNIPNNLRGARLNFGVVLFQLPMTSGQILP